jgi:hypothetical protein
MSELCSNAEPQFAGLLTVSDPCRNPFGNSRHFHSTAAGKYLIISRFPGRAILSEKLGLKDLCKWNPVFQFHSFIRENRRLHNSILLAYASPKIQHLQHLGTHIKCILCIACRFMHLFLTVRGNILRNLIFQRKPPNLNPSRQPRSPFPSIDDSSTALTHSSIDNRFHDTLQSPHSNPIQRPF